MMSLSYLFKSLAHWRPTVAAAVIAPLFSNNNEEQRTSNQESFVAGAIPLFAISHMAH